MESADVVSSLLLSLTAQEGRETAMLVGLLTLGVTCLSPISARLGMCCCFFLRSSTLLGLNAQLPTTNIRN